MMETAELLAIGAGVGVASGFFGVGGGSILVPVLLFLGFAVKEAIGISVIQMVFSSTFGSYVNFKKGTLETKVVFALGSGGFFGSLCSFFLIKYLNPQTLEWIFLTFILAALVRMFFKPQESTAKVRVNVPALFIIGAVVGMFSISAGVGGSILIVPLLVGFFNTPVKQAISAGLFFVVFSSVAGLISVSLLGHVDMLDGVIIGIGSLAGVYAGIHLKHAVSDQITRNLLLAFYFSVSSYMLYRLL